MIFYAAVANKFSRTAFYIMRDNVDYDSKKIFVLSRVVEVMNWKGE